MVDLVTGPIQENRRQAELGLDVFPSTTREVLEATGDDAWTRNPGPSLTRWLRRSVFRPMFSDATPMSAESANEAYGIPGQLSFAGPIFEASAREKYELKRAEIRRASVFRRAQGGTGEGIGGLAVGLLASAADPLSIASSFVPVVGQARYARMLEQAGSSLFGRAAVRAGVGLVEGAAGAALVEPIVFGVARDEQADYSAYDSLANLAFGGILGGGLHAGGGLLGDLWRGRLRAPAAEAADAAGPDARGAALRGAVADLVDAGQVDSAAPVLQSAPRPPRGFLEGAPTELNAPVFDASGRRIETRYRLAEADQLVASNLDDLSVNPAFPAELQPRQRERAASALQIQSIAGDLQPERLGRSSDASTGAPIIGGDLVVESGNARVLGIRRAYAEGRADQYRQFLRDQGFNDAGMRSPVLVRERTSPLTPEERRAFTQDAQNSGTLALSATERAMADAGRLDTVMDAWAGGDVGDARNSQFVRRFIGALPQPEQGAMLTAGGELSREGHRRIQSALLARAYGDADLLGRMVEASEDGSRSIGSALLELAPDWARMRKAAQDGTIAPGMDATRDLLDAVRAIRDARASKRPLAEVLQQVDAFQTRSPAADLFLSRILKGSSSGRVTTRSAKDIAEGLRSFVDEAMQSRPGVDLFGGPEPNAEAALRALERRDQRIADRDQLDRVDQAAAQAPEQLTDDVALKQIEAAEAEADLRLAELERAGAAEPDAPELAQVTDLMARAKAEGRRAEAAATCLLRRAA